VTFAFLRQLKVQRESSWHATRSEAFGNYTEQMQSALPIIIKEEFPNKMPVILCVLKLMNETYCRHWKRVDVDVLKYL
jgi:hypothetical protein